MTTDKKSVRIVALIMALVLSFMGLLSGCEMKRQSAFDAVGEMLSNAEKEAVMECEVVYPKGSSADIVMAARELATLLEDQTEMIVTAHRYESKYDYKKLYVVIGRVGDDITEYWYDGLGEQDYICRVYQNTVAIGGGSDKATLEAIKRFNEEILPTAEYGYIAGEGIVFEFKDDSQIVEEPIIECEVVYAKGSSADVAIAARDLSELLTDKTGMSVTAHRYENKYDDEKLYVVIGKVSDDVTEYWYDGMKDGDYICRAYRNTVALGGITDEATLEAIERFISEVLPTAEYGCIADEGLLFEFVAEDDGPEQDIVLECDVVYPQGSSAEIVMAARELASLLAEKTGMSVTAHKYGSKYSEEKLYVVIGKVSDDVTEYWYDGMKDGDYICKAYLNTVALGGVTDKATLNAIEKFISEVLPKAEYGCIADEGLLFEFVAEYDGPEQDTVLECDVVYPQGSSADIVMAARELASLLAEKTGMSVTAHKYGSKYSEKKLYVVIGKVSDDVTEYWYDGMKDGDYICKAYLNTVALGGVTDKATLNAIEKFISEVLPKAEYGHIADDGTLFEYNEISAEDKIMLNGCGLGEYTIIVNDSSLRAPAENFKEEIFVRTGYDLAVMLRNPYDNSKEIIVTVDDTVGVSKYNIYGYGNCIFVKSDSIYGVSLALDKLLIRLCDDNTAGKTEVNVYEMESYSYSNPEFQTAYYRISEDIGTSTVELESVSVAIKQSGADLIVLRLDNKYIFNAIKAYLFEDYGIDTLECADGSIVAILNRPNMTSIEKTSVALKDGIDVVYASVNCLGKKYDVFCLYPQDMIDDDCSRIIGECFASAVDPAICAVISSSNDGTVIDLADTDVYRRVVDDVVNSGAEKYRVCAFVTPSLDCHEKIPIAESDGRYVGASVSVRAGFIKS